MKKYLKYKDSGVEWIGEIPLDWKIIRLKYLCFVTTGDKNTQDSIDDGLYPFYVRSPQIEKINSYSFDGESVLTVGDGVGTGKVFHYINGKFDFHQRVYKFSHFKNISGKFFYWFIRTNFLNVSEDQNSKSTVDSLRLPLIQNFPFVIPSIPEQNQMIDYIDKKTTIIDDLIQKKQRKIELLKEHRTSIINQTVTKGLNPDVQMKDSGVEWIGEIPEHWSCIFIRHYYKKIGSGVTPRGGSEVYVEDGIIFIRSQNVYFDGLRLDDVVKITPETHLNMSGSKVEKGDLLLNITGGSIGRCCIVDLDEEMNVNQHVCIIRTKDSLTPVFLNYFLQSNTGQEQLEFFITGSNREGLTGDSIKNFRVPLPSIPEQQQTVQFLDQKTQEIDTTITLENQKIDLLKEYRQSLISEVVTGKIDVRKN